MTVRPENGELLVVQIDYDDGHSFNPQPAAQVIWRSARFFSTNVWQLERTRSATISEIG